jgi:hypothetical protein
VQQPYNYRVRNCHCWICTSSGSTAALNYSLVPCPVHDFQNIHGTKSYSGQNALDRWWNALAHLMAVVAAEAAGGADARVAGEHAGEAGEDGLAREVAAGIGALLAVVAAQHHIRLLGFRRRTKSPRKWQEQSLESSRNESNPTSGRGGEGRGRYQLLGLDALDVLVDGDGGLCLVRERVAAVSGHGPGILGLGFRGDQGYFPCALPRD